MMPYLVIFGCLLLSAFFSAAETAITSLGTLKARHLLESGGKSVAHLKFWISHPGRILTTILIFNTAVNILASSVATELAYVRFQNGAIGIATGITTFLVLVFGEVLPKSFAKAHYEKLAIPFLRVIIYVYYTCYPLISLLSGFADLVIRVVSSGRQHSTPLITEAELEFIVNEGEKAGVIGDIKKNIINGAFDFDETTVREIMTPRTDIKAFSIDTPLKDILAKAIDSGYSRFPIYRNHVDHMVGMLLVKDLLSQAASPKEGLVAKDIMREAHFAPESKSIMEVFKDLKRTKSHMAIIIDEYGGTAGIVTMEDILEEIVGEIQDEFDVEEAKILQVGDSLYDVSGSLNLDDFFDFFKLNLNTEDTLEKDQESDTIAGWVTQLIGQIPKVGQSVRINGLQLEVSEVKHRRIHMIRVQVLSEETQDED